MKNSSVAAVFFFLLSALIYDAHSLDYSDLEAQGLACPQRDKCTGYSNNASYIDRSCECDSKCQLFGDCCIDAPTRISGSEARSTPGNGMVCMPYGDTLHAGVYAIARCSSNWNGSPQVREKCENTQDDFTDPLNAAPVTNVNDNKTYRNRYCAECNNAPLASLELFTFRIACDGLYDMTREQLLANITYSPTWKMWGVDKLNSFGNDSQFYGCEISFDVPNYLNNSIRFCRSNLISSCPPSWSRNAVRSACQEYMAVVFSNGEAYRNGHCAFCNGKYVTDVSCTPDIAGRRKPFSISVMFDFNTRDGDQVGMRRIPTPVCAANQMYDHFFKQCREPVCALRGYQVVNGRCVRG